MFACLPLYTSDQQGTLKTVALQIISQLSILNYYSDLLPSDVCLD